VSWLSLVSERAQPGLGTSFTFHETVGFLSQVQQKPRSFVLAQFLALPLPASKMPNHHIVSDADASKLSSMATTRKEQHTLKSPSCMALLQSVQLLDVAETLTAD
jgi:hypothetical protein